ncbi:MAG TPA: SusD/RagB family nutrient-binding outer membrane lipoprotein, partial [Bacteroidales bacterium]|nr:SusD/RagB family nutrient-binding outer membrane lipoprotein [Bacteroidales bacterium]
MKTSKIKIYILLFLALGACRTWDEDYNTNLNRPQVTSSNPVPPKVFVGPMIDMAMENLPTPMLNVMTAVSEYTGKSYSVSQGNRHREWHDLDGNIWKPIYKTIQKVKDLRRTAKASNDNRYVAIADIWECYVMYTLTTIDGPIPYFDVVADNDELKYLIAYDAQDKIYPAILEKLKSAGLLINNTDENVDAQSDYVYAGDIQKWKRLSNTLRIRLAMYMYNAAPEQSKAIVNEILSSPDVYPIFQSNSDNFAVHYDGTVRISRWFKMGDDLLKQHLMSNILVERLISLKDPRLYIYARPVQKVQTDASKYVLPDNPGPVKYLGHLYGITTSNGDATNWNGGIEYASRIGSLFISADATMKATAESGANPIMLGTFSEMNFTLAEMAKRGIIGGGDATAKGYYEAGIKASMEMYNCQVKGNTSYDGAYADQGLNSFDEYLAQPHVSWTGGRNQNVLIAEQKWLSMCFLGFESYFDHRRSMLPALRASDGAIGYNTQGSGTKFPARTDYPSSETAENAKAVAEANATGFDIPVTGSADRTYARMWLINNAASPALQMPVFKEPL